MPSSAVSGRRHLRLPMLALTGLAMLTAAVTTMWLGGVRSGPRPTGTVTITIEQGSSTSQIANTLADAGLIRFPRFFELWVRVRGWQSSLRAGRYQFDAKTGAVGIARGLVGNAAQAMAFTAIEGWDTRAIVASLGDSGAISPQEFQQLVERPLAECPAAVCTAKFLALLPREATLEGYLFPDTYRVVPGSPAGALVAAMLATFERRLTQELRAEMERKGLGLHDVVILASIIQKEVAQPRDMRMAADVFSKRLADGIRLESDATINFITRKATTRPTARDLFVESPYNTYRHAGLPPGPISNPGIAAIRAVIDPESNPYYFFLTTPDGTAVYSRTFSEHLDNRRRYYP